MNSFILREYDKSVNNVGRYILDRSLLNYVQKITKTSDENLSFTGFIPHNIFGDILSKQVGQYNNLFSKTKSYSRFIEINSQDEFKDGFELEPPMENRQDFYLVVTPYDFKVVSGHLVDGNLVFKTYIRLEKNSLDSGRYSNIRRFHRVSSEWPSYNKRIIEEEVTLDSILSEFSYNSEYIFRIVKARGSYNKFLTDIVSYEHTKN